MRCNSCSSVNQKKFIGEMGVRSPGFSGLHKPIVFIFPQLDVCMDCGAAAFVVPEAELRQLSKDKSVSAEFIGN
jgi:hypothetical protein